MLLYLKKKIIKVLPLPILSLYRRAVTPYRLLKRRALLFFRSFISNKKVQDFFMGPHPLKKYALLKSADLLSNSNRHNHLYISAQIYKLNRKFTPAFELYFRLFKETMAVKYLHRAIACESKLAEKPLYNFYLSNKASLPDKVFHVLSCEYSLYYDAVTVSWDGIKKNLTEEFYLPLINKALLCALSEKNYEMIEWLKNLVIEFQSSQNEIAIRRTFTMIAACYYRTGQLDKLKELNTLVSYEAYDWNLYMSFGRNDIMSALDYRSKTIKKSFMHFYPEVKRQSSTRVLVPEKDLCGEAFNGMFYRALLDAEGTYVVACDRRLHKLLSNNFKGITFLPKVPRNRQEDEPLEFNWLPYGVAEYLDNSTYKKTKGADFFSIDYVNHFSHSETLLARHNGWIKPDPKLIAYWDTLLSNFSKGKRVGFCANSTLRSKVRDIHMISLDSWGEIFSIPETFFVNLNPSLDLEACRKLENDFGCTIFTPDFDLYNDFDNLLALMAALDCACVPPNNMMDFSASIGLKTLVFSPTNIMRNWVQKDTCKYIFSDNVFFVFNETTTRSDRCMVESGAEIIKDYLGFNSTVTSAA